MEKSATDNNSRWYDRIKDPNQSWKSFAIEVFLLILLVLFIRFYIFQLFWVSGESMCPTINQVEDECRDGRGEFAFVNKFWYYFFEPQRGDIVVFDPPKYAPKDDPYIKRIVGVPGDTIRIRGGKLYVTNEKKNIYDWRLPETYLAPKSQGMTRSTKSIFNVPDEHYLLFGDNRLGSLDARNCFSGDFSGCKNPNRSPYTSLEDFSGKAQAIVWPPWSMRKLENPLDGVRQ